MEIVNQTVKIPTTTRNRNCGDGNLVHAKIARRSGFFRCCRDVGRSTAAVGKHSAAAAAVNHAFCLFVCLLIDYTLSSLDTNATLVPLNAMLSLFPSDLHTAAPDLHTHSIVYRGQSNLRSPNALAGFNISRVFVAFARPSLLAQQKSTR